jgi:hypothetical protein
MHISHKRWRVCITASVHPLVDDRLISSSHAVTPSQSVFPPQVITNDQEPEFDMNHVALESPFATLRSMGARANDQISGESSSKDRYRTSPDHARTQDPLSVLTAKEAERAVEL